MTNLDYQDVLDKALSQLRMLEIDKALVFFYQLLQQHPLDISLIQRIYAIEIKKKKPDGFNKICQHIFSIDSKSKEFHQLIIATWIDYKNKLSIKLAPELLSEQQTFHLFFHSGTPYFFHFHFFHSQLKFWVKE